jgi:hypothetical protein
MKKLMLSAFHVFVASTILISSSKGQTNESKPAFKNVAVATAEGDRTKILMPTSKAETRAFRNFNRNYKPDANVSWYYSGEVLVASFTEGNKKKQVMYLKKGQWLHTLVYYGETQLSSYIKAMVNRNYPKFNITGVIEVHEKDLIFFFINIENEKEIKQIISFEDQMWTHLEYKKG